MSVCRVSDVGDRGRPAAGGKQCVRHGNGVEGMASRAGRRQRAPPPPAAKPHGQSHSRLDTELHTHADTLVFTSLSAPWINLISANDKTSTSMDQSTQLHTHLHTAYHNWSGRFEPHAVRTYSLLIQF